MRERTNGLGQAVAARSRGRWLVNRNVGRPTSSWLAEAMLTAGRELKTIPRLLEGA